MNFSKKTWYAIAAVVVLVLVGVGIFTRNKGTKTEAEPRNGNSGVEQQKPEQKQEDRTVSGSYWEGALKASDNAKKGNYMLVMDKTTVYISTSRDYSQLVGKNVQVSYEGTLDSFRLGDIVEK